MLTLEKVEPSDPRIPHKLLKEADPNESSIAEYLERSQVILAVLDGQVAGVAIYEIQGNNGTLWNLAVSTECRRHGFASKLIEAVIRQARKAYVKVLEVGTGNSSLGQLALYQKCGFRIDSVKKDAFCGYTPEIYENGIRCIDLVVLKLKFE